MCAHKHGKELTRGRGGQIREELASIQWFQWEGCNSFNSAIGEVNHWLDLVSREDQVYC